MDEPFFDRMLDTKAEQACIRLALSRHEYDKALWMAICSGLVVLTTRWLQVSEWLKQHNWMALSDACLTVGELHLVAACWLFKMGGGE